MVSSKRQTSERTEQDDREKKGMTAKSTLWERDKKRKKRTIAARFERARLSALGFESSQLTTLESNLFLINIFLFVVENYVKV